MWVHRRTEDLSPTDVTSYWVRPRLSAVGTSKKFIAAADFGASSFSPADSSRSGTSFMEEVLNVGLRENLEGQIIHRNTRTTWINWPFINYIVIFVLKVGFQWKIFWHFLVNK